MAVFRAFTFDGINSLDYGIYITGNAVYNAPARVVDMITVPGRNGDIAIDQGRFENIEVTYHAGCFADSQEEFARKVTEFRNLLASRYSYKRLTDDYNTGEYRMGLYKSGLQLSPVRYSSASEFDIVFECKPQRFLISGDRAISPTEWSDVQTGSGELVTIESDGSLAVKALEVSLEPIQSGSGTPSPTNVRPISGRTEVVTQRTGKNKLPTRADGYTNTSNGVKITFNSDGSITLNGTATATTIWNLISDTVSDNRLYLPQGDYILNGESVANNNFWIGAYRNADSGAWSISSKSNSGAFSLGEGEYIFPRIRIGSGVVLNNVTIKPMIRLSSDTDAAYEPYQGNTYTTALGRTVYGGTLDVVSGVLTVDRAYMTVGSMDWYKGSTGTYSRFYTGSAPSGIKIPTSQTAFANIISDRYATAPYFNDILTHNGQIAVNTTGAINITDGRYSDKSSFMNAMADTQIVYELATPQTYQLTPQQIDLLLGTNHLWSDGEITVEYGVSPYYNPTPFDARPLLVVTGSGDLNINGKTLSIYNGASGQVIYIDCETMEAWEVVNGVKTSRNDYIQNAGDSFPVLSAGNNSVVLGSGITSVQITPRWWRV